MDSYSLMCKCRGDETGALVEECLFHKVVRERDRYRDALEEIDRTLTIPAAEYVPAIGDVFRIIDRARKQRGHLAPRAKD